MYKALIVDDESWVAESLKDLVEWEKYGFEVVGLATGGVEALEAMREKRPDVVFTDIRMPEINGLELIRRGKPLYADMRFVVVSGYAEFAYAQRALMYGASAYCLKPFDEMEIQGVLAKLKEALDNERGTDAELLLRLLDDPEAADRERWLEALRKRGVLEWVRQGIVPVVAVGAADLPRPGGREIRLKTGAAKTAYLMSESLVPAALESWLVTMPPGLSGIGVGARVNDWQELRETIEQADSAAYQFFVEGAPGVYGLREESVPALDELMVKARADIADRNGSAVADTLDRIGALFAAGELTIRHAFQVYTMTVSLLYGLERKETMLYSCEQLIRSFGDAEGMIAELKTAADRHLRQAASAAPESRNQTFNAILHFVTDNFRRDLSLQELSEQFYMNPSYISQLFKKEVGETFTAYVARLRVSQARELLERGEDTIQEIAEKVGYRDYFYFTRLFKKLTGLTPTQYRELRP